MRTYRFGRLAASAAGVVAITVALVLSISGAASAAAIQPDATANNKSRAQFKTACEGRDGTYSEGTGKDVGGEEYHKLTCNSSAGIHSCKHQFVTKDCTFQPSRRIAGTSQKTLNGANPGRWGLGGGPS
jgi:hypothetical protein